MLSGETFLEALAKLKNHGAWTLVCHEHPDGDTLGSAFALYSLVRKCGRWLIVPAMLGGSALVFA